MTAEAIDKDRGGGFGRADANNYGFLDGNSRSTCARTVNRTRREPRLAPASDRHPSPLRTNDEK